MCIRLFVARLLAFEAVIVVRQRAFAFAAVRQADFEEAVAHHEGEVAGVVVQLQVFFVGGVAVEAAGGVAFWFFAQFGGLDGVFARTVQGQAGLQTVAVRAGQDAVVGAFERVGSGLGGGRRCLCVGLRRRRGVVGEAAHAAGEQQGNEQACGLDVFFHVVSPWVRFFGRVMYPGGKVWAMRVAFRSFYGGCMAFTYT